MEQPTHEERPPSQPRNGLKKIASRSNISRSTASEHESSVTSEHNGGAAALDGPPLEKLTTAPTGSAEREGSHSGLSKLIPGARRRRRKKQETRDSENGMGLIAGGSEDSLAAPDPRRRSVSDPGGDPATNGRTGCSHDNSSSPAIVIPDSASGDASARNSDTASDHAQRATRANTLAAPDRERTVSKSPSRGSLQSAFAPSSDTRRSQSPDRASTKSSNSKKSKRNFFKSSRRSSLSAKKSPMPSEDIPPVPTAPPNITTSPASKPVLERLRTPPDSPAPEIKALVTPPTPTDKKPRDISPPRTSLVQSPEQVISKPLLPPNAVVSPSGNMISHRRVRSASAAPNKTSNGIAGSVEEGKSLGSKDLGASQNGSGFFSTMFSAAQNAASSLSSTLNSQPRQRSSTEPADVDKQAQSTLSESAPELPQQEQEEPDDVKKELAVDTLGTGDLDFSHLGIDTTAGGVIKTKDGVVFTKMNQGDRSRKSTISQRDELAAKIEDVKAAQAVNMAYEKPLESATSVVEDTVPESHHSGGKDSTEDHSPPQERMLADEADDTMQRSGSLRSGRRRRTRQSSGAAGTTVGAIGAAIGGMALPGMSANVPRLTGFAVASKKRNREFHQLFRSVPEDDYLIEDYSCALQREIILAGRIYISEGHVCFSSNILGWVTTLVIGFDEVVAIEKESTAMVFPNAIAVKTLHARHIFRSLLSRDSTYDLMVNIWKISHPTLKSSVNGTQVAQGTGDKTEKTEDSNTESGSGSVVEDIYDEDEEGAGTVYGDALDDSLTGSEPSDSKLVNGQQSTVQPATALPQPAAAGDSDTKSRNRAISSADKGAEFPGPKTHPPTDFTDPSAYYERVMKDETIPAPLGQVYSLVFGPESGAFISKFLVSDQKVTDLQFDDDKTGLTNENRTRTYSYIKPLYASMGPKQTKCITVENLDFLDLEKAVLVTLTTQTPDVPSGNVFNVKTKYVFTWAPGNATRFYMSCTVEWTGKSWIKGPVERGANEGQLSYGADLVKALRSGVAPRTKPAGKGVSKVKRRARGHAADAGAVAAVDVAKAASRQAGNWGIFEPLRQPLSPLVDTFQPLFNGTFAVGIICMLLFMMWFRSPGTSSVGHTGAREPIPSFAERMVAYEELWRQEESDLWDWLEERVGMDTLSFPVADPDSKRGGQSRGKKQLHKRRSGSEGDLESRLRGERMTEKQIEDAIRVTHERLETLQRVVEKRKSERNMAEANNKAAT